MKRNFKKIALAASLAAFGCNSFIIAGDFSDALTYKLLSILGTGGFLKAFNDSFGILDSLALKNALNSGKCPDVLKDTKMSKELAEKANKDEKKENQNINEGGQWGEDKNLWDLIKKIKENSASYSQKTNQLAVREFYEGLHKYDVLPRFQVFKNREIKKTITT